jgi:hypothetical protein
LVESGVGYVKGNALKGRVFHSLDEENRHLLDWETTVADLRIHGTEQLKKDLVPEQPKKLKGTRLLTRRSPIGW